MLHIKQDITLTLSQISLCFHVSEVRSFDNTIGKGEISPFPAVFPTYLENFLPFSTQLKLLSASSIGLEESKICCLGKGLRSIKSIWSYS